MPNTLQYAHVHLSWIFPRNTRQIYQCLSKSRPTMTYPCKKPVEPQVVNSQILYVFWHSLMHSWGISLGYPVYPGGNRLFWTVKTLDDKFHFSTRNHLTCCIDPSLQMLYSFLFQEDLQCPEINDPKFPTDRFGFTDSQQWATTPHLSWSYC